MAITVAINAASAVARAGLTGIIGATPDLRLAAAPRADVLLIDLPAGEEIALLLPEAAPGTPAVVLLGDPTAPGLAAAALGRGVRAILPHTATEAEIVAAVRAAAAGLVVLHPAIADTVLGPALAGPPVRALDSSSEAPQRLTAREIEVLALLAEGASNKVIARRLGISDHTVKFHVSSIFTKLGAASRTEAVTLGARLGLILL